MVYSQVPKSPTDTDQCKYELHIPLGSIGKGALYLTITVSLRTETVNMNFWRRLNINAGVPHARCASTVRVLPWRQLPALQTTQDWESTRHLDTKLAGLGWPALCHGSI